MQGHIEREKSLFNTPYIFPTRYPTSFRPPMILRKWQQLPSSPGYTTHSSQASPFHRLGAGGKPPFGGALTCGDVPGAGAGRIGRDMTFWPLEALDVREGYAGRGGADAEPFESECLCSLLVGGDRSRSFSRTADEGAEGARCDLRLLCSIMLIAQASRSTGVRFAA